LLATEWSDKLLPVVVWSGTDWQSVLHSFQGGRIGNPSHHSWPYSDLSTSTVSLPVTRETGNRGVRDCTSCQECCVIFTCVALTPPLPSVESIPSQRPSISTSTQV